MENEENKIFLPHTSLLGSLDLFPVSQGLQEIFSLHVDKYIEEIELIQYKTYKEQTQKSNNGSFLVMGGVDKYSYVGQI